MGKKYKQAILGTVAATALVAGGAAPALAEESALATDGLARVEADAAGKSSVDALAEADAAQGMFSYDQTTITPNSVIRSVFAKATAALCGATVDFAFDNPLQWKLTVSGFVDNGFTATVDELASESAVEQVMTCSCGGNPADGAAIITAEVKGIPITHLLDKAEARSGANAVTFVSSDGTELTIPLGYLVGRHAVISYEINDEDLSASVGGNNQLWMTRTPANYFIRDIVEVRIAKEDVAPAAPGEDMEFPNSPNVGILSSSISEDAS